jgi:hypothetical protein
VDFYGSGGSSGSGTTIGVNESDDVAATVAYAKTVWPQRKIVLYGISMGGAAVLRAIAVNGVTPDTAIIEATFDSLLNTGKNRFRAMGLPPSPFTELLLFWGSVQQFNYFRNPAQYATRWNTRYYFPRRAGPTSDAAEAQDCRSVGPARPNGCVSRRAPYGDRRCAPQEWMGIDHSCNVVLGKPPSRFTALIWAFGEMKKVILPAGR